MSIDFERFVLQRFGQDAASAAVAAPAGPDNSAASEQPGGGVQPQPEAAASDAAAPTVRDETAENRARLLAARRGREVRSIWNGWLQECRALQQTYPEFDPAAELNDPDFVRLLRSGVSVRTAYQARHLESLLGGAMQYAAQRAAESAAAQWASRSARPAENGAQPHAGAVLHTNVAKLTAAQRAELERRATKGERIVL